MMLNAALKYIRAGFSIIPLKPREKTPLIKWAKFQERKPTEKEVITWWTRWPNANIGLLTGQINNLIVFDKDGPEAERIIKEGGGFPPGPQAVTRKGRHFLFQRLVFSVQNDVNKKLDLDIRGDGGYIVAPPSIHPSGSTYSWAPGLSLFEIELPEMRPWQVEYVKKYCIVDSKGQRNPPDWEKKALKGVGKGQRNDMAAKLAGRYIAKGLTDDEIVPIILFWNKKNRPPLPTQEIFTIIKSVRQKDARKAKKESRSPFDGDDIPAPLEQDVTPSDFFDDKKFIPQWLAKYLEMEFKPLVFDGAEFYSYHNSGVWKPVEFDLLGQKAENVLGKYAKSARIQDSIKLLGHRVFIKPQNFKHNPEYLNLKNGMLELSSMDIKNHAPEFFSRIQLPIELNRKAKCPRWDQFLHEVFPGEEGKVKALQSFLGYCLLPDCRHQRCLFMIGSGANGKSVIIDTLVAILGQENVCTLPIQLMSQRFIIGQLKDKLLNVASELSTNQPIDTSVFKDAVSGGLLMADQKHGKAFSFWPIAKHVFSMNEVPKITDKSHGFQRRPIVLIFNERFEGDRRDPYLTKKLIAERDGIFAWMLEGLYMVLEKDDLLIPDVVKRDTQQFVKSTNPAMLFVEDCCILGDDYQVKPKDLFKSYKAWCQEGCNRPLSRNRFYDQVLIHFPTVVKKQIGDDKTRMYIGIGLRDDAPLLI